MPFGPEPLGLVYLASVKLAGYSLFGTYLRKKFRTDQPRALTFGAARTILGLVVGIGFASFLAVMEVPRTEIAFYLLLFPVRFGEWVLAIWFFFGRKRLLVLSSVPRNAMLGSCWSYLLDVPAIASVFVLPGGAWIC